MPFYGLRPAAPVPLQIAPASALLWFEPMMKAFGIKRDLAKMHRLRQDITTTYTPTDETNGDDVRPEEIRLEPNTHACMHVSFWIFPESPGFEWLPFGRVRPRGQVRFFVCLTFYVDPLILCFVQPPNGVVFRLKNLEIGDEFEMEGFCLDGHRRVVSAVVDKGTACIRGGKYALRTRFTVEVSDQYFYQHARYFDARCEDRLPSE